MAGALMNSKGTLALLVVALTAAASQLGVAEELPDPMRPAFAVSTAPANAGSGQGEPPVQQLQSVILRRGQRPSAIINGQVVELGGDVAGARVTAIKESEVVLQGPAGKEVLKLTPAVTKQTVAEKRAVDRTSRTRNDRGNGDHGTR